MSQVMLSQQTVADLDIAYGNDVLEHDWQGRMMLRQDAVAGVAEGELSAHLEALGLDSLRDYLGWCRNYGFALQLGKNRRQLERERALVCLEREQTAVDPSRQLGEAIVRIYEGQVGEADWKDETLVHIHEGFLGASDQDEREALLQLLMWLDERTDLGYGGVMIPRLGRRPGNTFIEGVIALCRRHRDWQRSLDGCHLASEHPRLQFGVLVRQLMVQEGVPAFMDAAWFRGNDRIVERQQGWFMFLGRGPDICLAPEPPRLTRQMGREFVDAPAYCTIEEAMRWGQVLGQGGDEALAQAVIDTPLSTTFRNANFWDEVIRYFVANRELDPSCVGTVVDYLESQRFERKTVVHPDGSTERLKPAHPKLQMKGRQLGKLLRQVEAWHLKLTADDERTSALVRWHLRDEILRWGRHQGVPNRSFAGPLHHLDLLGMGTEVDYRAWCVENGFETGLFKNSKARFQELSAGVAAVNQTEDEALHEHLEILGLETDAYRAWCRDRGFSDGLDKNRRQLRREIRLMERIRGEAALVKRRNQTRRPDETIAQIYAGKIDANTLRADYLGKIHDGFEALKGDEAKREALFELLCRVARVADLFGPGRAFSGFGDQPGNTWVDGLMALAHVHQNWIRRVADWKPKYHHPRRQFGDLARHLLSKFYLPRFMDSVWFKGDTEIARQQQEWFIHVGMGQNIRTADVPARLTKMMAHRMMESPDSFTLEQAMRRGQILGMGGDEMLVRSVLNTRLGDSFEHEDFWMTVVQFLVNSPMLDPDYVRPIVEYIHQQKYVPEEVVQPDGRVEQFEPAYPSFSMKDRSRTKLLRQVDRWMGHHKQADKDSGKGWKRSGFEGLTFSGMDRRSGRTLTWSVQELCSGKELAEEGKAMRHCVSSYVTRCKRGAISVWSIQLAIDGSKPDRVLTVAVNNRQKCVTQSRGRFNAPHWEGQSQAPGKKRLSRSGRQKLMDVNQVFGMWLRQEQIRYTG